MPLGQAAAIFADHEREMEKGWQGRQIERLEDQDLSGGGIEKIVAASDIRDAERMIIDHGGELVRRLAGLGPDDEVANALTRIRDLIAGEGVVEANVAIIDDKPPASALCLMIKVAWGDRRSEFRRESDFAGRIIRWRMGRRLGQFNLFARQVARVRHGRLRECLHRGSIRIKAVGLQNGFAVPIQPQPLQVMQDVGNSVALDARPR